MKVRVYDYGKKEEGARYTMYFPFPKSMQVVEGMKAIGFGFNFNTNYRNYTQRYESLEFKNGLYGVNIGKPVKRETLPQFIQDKINVLEKVFNNAVKYNDTTHWKIFFITVNRF